MLNTEGLCLGCMSDNGGERICPVCGHDNNTTNPADCLPIKSIIENRYLLGKVLELDGEGITYIGWDNAKSAKVKIKEYFPRGFAHRNPDKTVSIVESGKYTFNEGLLEFIEINKAIMLSTLPSLTAVYDVFEENGTAYAVTELISGITLEEFLNKNGGTLKWEQARPLFLPLIDTLSSMNEMGFIHGGISTETVIVGRDGKLRISKYCVKKLRRSDSEMDAVIYDGYAAAEQYGINGMRTDTYTDVYGLCATLFRVFIGTAPPIAPERLENDVMTIPARFAEELPRQVLASLANGLQVLPQNRTKTVETLKNEMVYGEIEMPAVKETEPKEEKDITSSKTKSRAKKGSSAKYALISALCTVLAFVAIAVILIFTVFKDSVFKDKNASSENNIVSIITEQEDEDKVESVPDVTAKTYTVPDLTGKYFAEIIENEEYEMFEFSIESKVYSNTATRGTVCNQSVKSGTQAVRDTKIVLTISLGKQEIAIPNLKGMDELNAKLELLKQGFLYENIKVTEKYDGDSQPQTVLEQSPKYGEKVSTDTVVEIYINSYTGDSEESSSSNN